LLDAVDLGDALVAERALGHLGGELVQFAAAGQARAGGQYEGGARRDDGSAQAVRRLVHLLALSA
jgi:hypothetical protein